MNAVVSSVLSAAGDLVQKISRKALRILKGTATFEDRYFASYEELGKLIEHFRSMGCIIVFTSGTWDLIHIGHCDYLQKGKDEARKLFPEAEQFILVVGVDTDALTKGRKGPMRPIVPEEERLRILSHVRAVDVLAPMHNFTDIYAIVRPDVQIISKSTGDMEEEPEHIKKHCKHLVKLPPQAETSTSARVRRLTLDGSLATLKRLQEKLHGVLRELTDELG